MHRESLSRFELGGVLIWRYSDPDAPKRPGRYLVRLVKLGHDFELNRRTGGLTEASDGGNLQSKLVRSHRR